MQLMPSAVEQFLPAVTLLHPAHLKKDKTLRVNALTSKEIVSIGKQYENN